MVAGGIFEFMNQYVYKPNRVKELQKFYQTGPLPVHLKGQIGISVYRTMMWGTSLGLIYCGFEFYKMAIGKKKRAI